MNIHVAHYYKYGSLRGPDRIFSKTVSILLLSLISPITLYFDYTSITRVMTLQWVATMTTTIAQMVYQVVTRGGMVQYT